MSSKLRSKLHKLSKQESQNKISRSSPSFSEKQEKSSKKEYSQNISSQGYKPTDTPSETTSKKKLTNFINLLSHNELQDFKMLEKIAEHDEEARNQLEMLHGGQFLTYPKKGNESKILETKFQFNENYNNIQKTVEKTILDAVSALEDDLNLLPEMQKNNPIIHKLTSLKAPENPTRKNRKLPSIIKQNEKTSNKTLFNVLEEINSQSEISENPFPQREAPKEIKLAGFYMKKKISNHKIDREKHQFRRDYLETFRKSHTVVKDLSQQYLFNLTQFNTENSRDHSLFYDSDMSENPSSLRRFTNESPIQNSVKRPSAFFRDKLPSFTKPKEYIQNYPQKQRANSNLNMIVSPKGFKKTSLQLEKGTLNYSLASRKSSLNPENLKSLNKQFTNDYWSQEAGLDDAFAKKDKLIFEGMGLLTLHAKHKKATPKNLSNYSTDYFSMNVKSLREKDLKYIQTRTGVNMKHQLYDKVFQGEDIMRFQKQDLKHLL